MEREPTEAAPTLLSRVEELAARIPAAEAVREERLQKARIEAALTRLEIRFGVRGRVEQIGRHEVYLLDDLVFEEEVEMRSRDPRTLTHTPQVLGCYQRGGRITVRRQTVETVDDLVSLRLRSPELSLHADLVLPILAQESGSSLDDFDDPYDPFN